MPNQHLEAVKRALGREVLLPSDRFESFGLDSLEFLDFLLTVQTETGIQIHDGRIAELNTVADLLKVLDELHVSA